MDNHPQQSDSSFPSQRTLILWLAALVIAFAVDGPAARLCLPIAHVVKQSETAEELKEGGHFIFVLILAIFIWILHPSRLRGAMLLCLSGVTSGIFYGVLKWMVGRTRPIVAIEPFHFEPFSRGLSGLFHAHNMAFPSGHAGLAFATAACLSCLLPRGRWAFFLMAGLVAAERVAELAHYVSDVVAGAALGIVAFQLTLRLFELFEMRSGTRGAEPAAL